MFVLPNMTLKCALVVTKGALQLESNKRRETERKSALLNGAHIRALVCRGRSIHTFLSVTLEGPIRHMEYEPLLRSQRGTNRSKQSHSACAEIVNCTLNLVPFVERGKRQRGVGVLEMKCVAVELLILD